MTARRYWRVRVVRGDVVIASRIAPIELAEQYASVLRVLYPNDQVRCDRIPENETADPTDRPYDPRD
ncbi:MULTISPECIES: hypothetical protein [unclassified Kribbella]|uniref:hypothetical protein n=1 Tax=unclassified Kribbella TaxID=2644121 RepID=UPI00340E685C